MDFEVYCDESRQDLIAQKQSNKFFLIGGLWLPATLKDQIKKDIKNLRDKYSVKGEVKWNKVSPSKIRFYCSLVDLFLSHEDKLRFRCIVIDSGNVDLKWHNDDKELGFYKFYYQLLHNWISDFNSYTVFCDTKTNRDPSRLKELTYCLRASNLSSDVNFVQALPSHEVVLIQFVDVLLGAVSAKINNSITSQAKLSIIQRLEDGLKHELLPTAVSEKKFNIFKIRLEGGW